MMMEPGHLPPNNGESNEANPKKAHTRVAAGKVWQDQSLADWPENDFRLFVGNVSKDVTDQQLYEHFAKYPSLQMVKIIRELKTGMSKGYGFVSLLEPMECARAIREMDQTWLSARPIKVKRSDWKDRELKNVKKKQKRHHRKMNPRGML
jgi:RNA recognition motif-containing protein